jgi:site-specific recombinase XerD
MKKAHSPNALARAVHAFFGEYVPELRGLSRHTLLSYRDTLALLLRFVAKSRNTDPASLDLESISPESVLTFLNYLEQERHNKISSRNVRLAAIHAFFRYVAIHTPERIEQAQRILGIPFKRTGTRPIDYLEYEEIAAVLNSVGRTTQEGSRDYALLALMFNTGARVQEIVDLNACDLQLDSPAQVKLFGKGRKTRICPLWQQTAQVLKQFLSDADLHLRSTAAVFCNQRGERLSRFGIRYILAKYCKRASTECPSLAGKRLHPHSMRHSCAIHLLKSGVDLASISHWLGHASMNTTNRYATADLEMKRQTIARARSPGESLAPSASWRHDASVIEWLKSL